MRYHELSVDNVSCLPAPGSGNYRMCGSTRKFEFGKRKELTGTANSEEEPGWHQIFPEQGGRADVRASGNVSSDTIAFSVLYS